LIVFIFFTLKMIFLVFIRSNKFSVVSNAIKFPLYEKKKHKIDQIINKVKDAGMEIYDISTNAGNLEDVFIDLTKS